MPRKPRIQQPGMIHHVIVRGNNQESIFREDADKIRYLQLVNRYKERHLFKLLAYCIMDNHIHLLIKQGNMSLSKSMQGIQQSFTQYYNTKYNCIGHVFHQRFKSFPVDDDAYLLALIAYIHNNPKVAGVVNDLGNYKWSSHIEIIRPSKKNIADVEYLFDFIDRDLSQSIPEYLWLLGEVNDESIKQCYLGGKRLEERESEIYIDERKDLIENRKYPINFIIDFVDGYILSKNLDINIPNKRRVIVMLSDEFCNEKKREIAEKIGVRPNRVSMIRGEHYNNQIKEDVLKVYHDIKHEIMKKYKN